MSHHLFRQSLERLRSRRGHTSVLLTCWLSMFCGTAGAQSLAEPQNQTAPVRDVRTAEVPPPPDAPPPDAPPPQEGYVIGSGDQLSVHVVGMEEASEKTASVDLLGTIRLPVAGRIKVAGLTAAEVEAEITKRLKVYMLRPDVSVSIVEFKSQPVSVIGAVRSPGVHQVQGRRSLVEVLSLVGGLDPTAGNTLKLTRRLEWGRIPLPEAADDPTNQFSVAELKLKSLLEAKRPGENILVKPYDVISVPRADTVYVIGQVMKAGGYILNDQGAVTALQALSMAGGLDRAARPQHARILRTKPGASARTEIPIDLKKVLDGSSPDLRLEAEDILVVPDSLPKHAFLRALEAAVQVGTGVAIYRR